MYFIHIIINQNVNDANKVHRNFPLDICLICLKYFPALICVYLIGLRLILHTIIQSSVLAPIF